MCHNREQKIAGHMDAPNLPSGTRHGGREKRHLLTSRKRQEGREDTMM